jgi:mRNA interferase RelE/StbE
LAWNIIYTPKALKQLRALDKPVAARIVSFFFDRVAISDPYSLSEPLAGPLAGKRRFRVGDYRIICEIVREEVIVSVLKVGHRKEVYD